MIEKKTVEVKHAKKIIARIFQRRLVIMLFILFLLASIVATDTIIGYSNNKDVSIFGKIISVVFISYLFSLIPTCLNPYTCIIRMINWYALDATDQKELTRRLKVISAIIRVDLLFDGKITLWKTTKETQITKIDIEPFKGCKHFIVTNDNIQNIVRNDIFSITFKRYIPILHIWYMMGDWVDLIRIIRCLKEVTGINIRKWRKSKRKKYGHF